MYKLQELISDTKTNIKIAYSANKIGDETTKPTNHKSTNNSQNNQFSRKKISTSQKKQGSCGAPLLTIVFNGNFIAFRPSFFSVNLMN